mgnify:CR=1 FL=1
MSQEFLVIYEEDATGDEGDFEADELVLDIHMLRKAFTKQVDVETRVHIDIEGRSDPVGITGLVVSAIGAVLALAGTFVFATTYPGDWHQGAAVVGSSLRRLTATLFVLGGLSMLAGTILAASGRRVRAQGRVEEAHIVSKEPHAHVELH